MKMTLDNTVARAALPRVSPEEALEGLRNRMEPKFRHARNAAWLAWLGAATFVKWLLLLVLGYLIMYQAMGSRALFLAAFFAGSAWLAYSAYGRMAKRFGISWKKKGNGMLLGRSFRHFTESAGRQGEPMEVGSDSSRWIDYLKEPNPHMLLMGSTSSGKTVTLLALMARASLAYGVSFLMIDWNGENEEWAKSVNATVWKVPRNFKVNPFKLNGLSKEARASMAMESLAVAARLTALQSTKVKSALLRFYMDGTEPSLYDLWDALCSKSAGKANVLNQRLRAIQRVIGYEPDALWNEIFGRNNLISLAGLNESEKSLVAYSLVQRLTELFDKRPELNARLRLMVAMDEAWQFFRQERDFDTDRESSLEKVVRLGRKYGFGLIISTQQLDDIPKVFINSCALIMVHQQRESGYHGFDILNLGRYESALLRGAAQGEMLLLDRGAAQRGNWWCDYVKVQPLSSGEIRALAEKYKRIEPAVIHEPEMPIEMHDAGIDVSAGGGIKNALKGVDMPSVAVYRFMVCLARAGDVSEAYKMLREKGWLTSKASIYGGLGKPSILARAKSSGYVNENNEFTVKGLGVVNPGKLIERQGVLAGSEEHKRLMEKTITKIQDSGNFAFTTSDKDGFDVGEIKAKTKSAWDIDRLAIYECQTNAMKEEIEKGVERAKENNASLVWATASEDALEEIKRLTEKRNEYIHL